MRESNYRSIANNRAAVTITTSLYDRRALDVTSDKPLVNSLNHLTYLVSSSAKVRETLANDGGIERLVAILHECQSRKFASLDALYVSEQKLLTAWKWTLAFQCIVLIGTRGTEKIRQKVVCAGMLPVIATIFDNYQCLRENAFAAGQQAVAGSGCPYMLSQFYEQSVIEQTQNHTHLPNHSQPRFAQAPNAQNPINQHQHQSPHQFHNQHSQNQNQPQQSFTAAISGGGLGVPLGTTAQTQATNGLLPYPREVDEDTRAGTFMNIRLPRNHPVINANNVGNGVNNSNVNGAANNGNVTNDINNRDTIQIANASNADVIAVADPEGDGNLNATQNTNLNLNPLDRTDLAPNTGLLQQTTTTTTPNPAPFFLMGMSNSAVRSDSDMSKESSPIPGTFHIGNLTCEDYDNLSILQLLKLVKADANVNPAIRENSFAGGMDSNIRKGYLTVVLLNKLREAKEKEQDMSYLTGDDQIEMDTNLNFLTDLYLQDERSIHTSNTINTKIAPRNFTDTGIIIPRDDDVVWCLQLLAYVSKYPYLKDILQNTHLVPNMSIREKQLRMLSTEKMVSPRANQQRPIEARETLIPRLRKGRYFGPSTLQVGATTDVNTFIDGCDPSLDYLGEDLNIRNETFGLAGNTIEQYEKVNTSGLAQDNVHESDDDFDDFDEDSDHKTRDDEEEVDEYLSQFDDNVTLSAQNSSYLTTMYDGIIDAESMSNDLDRRLALNHLNMKISRLARAESQMLSNSIIEKRLEQKLTYSQVWDYNTYQHFDIDEDTHDGCTDVDESLLQYKKVNLFPMVEQFTFFGGTDMYYWSGVIMRNSCRRNDFKGGVRQCGNLECGRWEKYPREFSKCKRCKRTKYCSRECQTRAWACHKNWCVPSNSSNSTTTTDSVPTQPDHNNERAGNVATATGSDGEGNSFANSDSQSARPSDHDSQPMDL